eukprot:g5499.t1
MDRSSDPFARCVASIVGSGLAETATVPVDLAKTRLQVQRKHLGTLQYTGLMNCLYKVKVEEGNAALFKGLKPALLRQVCYSSLAMICYEPIRNVFERDGKTNYLKRLAAGGIAGATSITIFNPLEVLKTKMMIFSGSQRQLSMLQVAKTIYKADGIVGFWAGYKPNIARVFLVNAAELGTYDEAKSHLVPVTGDNVFAHVGASTVAAFTSAFVSGPADVVKTRLMNQSGIVGGAKYNGMLHVLIKTVKDEGIFALWKGANSVIVRKVLWCSIFFSSYEKVRVVVNGGPLIY